MVTRVTPFSGSVVPTAPSGPESFIISDPHVPLHVPLPGNDPIDVSPPTPSAPTMSSTSRPTLQSLPSSPVSRINSSSMHSARTGEFRQRPLFMPDDVAAPVAHMLNGSDEDDASSVATSVSPGSRHRGSHISSFEASRMTEATSGEMSTQKTGLTVNGSESISPAKRNALLHSKNTQSAIKAAHHSRRKREVCRTCCRMMVENRWFVALTTFFTIYALIGDDLRLAATNQPVDFVFDIFTLTCLVLFTFEIVCSCFGKGDYYASFFFWLDVISTFTLILDLTFVAEQLLGDGEGVDKLRSGRTARVGAKAGRVVRVVRLVRIIKLWKAIQDAKREQQRRANQKNDPDDPDDWGEDDANSARSRIDSHGHHRESRVGRKLSEMTTRRVVLLVLTMLLVLPFLQTDNSNQPPGTPWFAADNVYEAFKEWNTTGVESDRLRYERAILKYLYYHNWYTGNIDSWVPSEDLSPRSFQSHLFWVGVMSSDQDTLSSWYPDPSLRSSSVEAFQKEILKSDAGAIYNRGKMPEEALPLISAKWRQDCPTSGGNHRMGFSILVNEISDKLSYAVPCPDTLRYNEKKKYYPRLSTVDEFNSWHFAFYFDIRPLSKQESIYALSTTVFICIVLCMASLQFSNDANRLILRPVENMVKRVEMIRNDPLIAVKMADEEFKIEEMAKMRKLKRGRSNQFAKFSFQAASCGSLCATLNPTVAEPMETVILEKTIIKLGSLLALGFGEAGANIIGHNLESSDSAGVNAMIQGVRVEAIIGSARIRDFSTATEVLRSKVMTFVNQIAEIVHGVVSEFHGAANKNNGDTFLLIWRISGLDVAMTQRMADMSTIAFARILGEIHQSPILASYRGHPALQQRLGKNCRVCVTLGLHSGWAIEGAVGSEFKIDASYLSPNVSIAVQVEQATSIYNVPILITEQVIQLCCPEIAAKYRKIDQVKIRGSANPTCLFCLDLDYMCLKVDTDFSSRPATWNSRLRFKARQFLEAEKSRKLDLEVRTVTMFEQCEEISQMRRRYSTEFLQLFNMGFQNYMEGEWQVAGRLLTQTRGMLRKNIEDGPSSALLRFMEQSGFNAPSGWAGIHELGV